MFYDENCMYKLESNIINIITKNSYNSAKCFHTSICSWFHYVVDTRRENVVESMD